MEAARAEETSEDLRKLDSEALWIAQAGSHRSWLKDLCTVLLDSGGVKSEALLLSRPLCLVRTFSRTSQCPLLLILVDLVPHQALSPCSSGILPLS